MERFKAAVALKLNSVLTNLNKYRRKDPLLVVCQPMETEEALWLRFFYGEQSQSLSIPKPYLDDYKNYVIGRQVKRAVGTWYHGDTEFKYWELMAWLLTGRIETAFPNVNKKSQLERLVLSFDNRQAPLAFRSLQDIIDTLVNRLPLTGTPMETWAMCNRVVFLDPKFDSLTPQLALEYQREMNRKHFPWTSVGLSDSGMCNNNLLKVDLRAFTPFGIKHHNPMRNLYQTLGMKGDERPLVRTASMKKLDELQSVSRRGWNWNTCFLDVPLNFEDQLIIDNRHLDKFTAESRRFLCFGHPVVNAGDELEEGSVLAVEPNGKELRFWVRSDRAVVTAIEGDKIAFNGQEREVHWVYVETKHVFKEGIKLTNRHGNKGVVTFADCGTMVNESTGQEEPIDIIVSARTIGKRRNFGQVLEILLNLTSGNKPVTIPDTAEISLTELKQHLRSRGLSEDGTSPVQTQWFKGRALCGSCFWGLIKNPENQLWTKAEVQATDHRGRRSSGVKLSHIELKALTTIFGPDNAVVQEVLSHQQGIEDVHELVEALEVLRGKSYSMPIIDWSSIKPLQQNGGYFHSRQELRATIVDESLAPEGFILRLPRLYHVFIPDDESEDVEFNLVSGDNPDLEGTAKPEGDNVFIDKIFVPSAGLRGNWEHPTSSWGLSDIGGFLNNIVLACHDLAQGGRTDNLARGLERYFNHIGRRLSTKSGEIATYALAVRYPHSAKATATLAKAGLPDNWLEIHRSMAEDLGVVDGDYIIAERFPCLGFKSLRIQRVRVTDDPQCRFVIRVSGNSLVSQNLDFDGDVLFVMSFKTEEAQKLLEKEFLQPHESRKHYIDEANAAKQPETRSASLDDIGFRKFDPIDAEQQADIVKGLTGIKRGTGTVVALAYNLMRVIEGNIGFDDRETNLAMEVIMDKVANSVFGQKHAGKSLEERCKQAICTADLQEMLAMGFPEAGSRRLCKIITKEAAEVGVTDLKRHYKSHLTKGHSNVINLIVRKKHRFYFATRANLHPVRLLQHLDGPPTDLTSLLWCRTAQRKESNEMPPMSK